MRKKIVGTDKPEVTSSGQPWLDLERLAQIEITSEETEHPIEAALKPGSGSGWRAAQPGEQKIRLLFDEPLHLKRIRLAFREDQRERTQEFALQWSPDGGQSYRPILRQQYSFSPGGATQQVEDYTVNLDGVTALEVTIVPDIRGGSARASLAELQIA